MKNNKLTHIQADIYDETSILENGAFNYSRNAHFDTHIHKQIELHYVVSGEFEVCINHIPYIARKNELVLIKSYDLHDCKGGRKNKLISPILPDDMTNLLMSKNIKSQIIKDIEFGLEHILNLSKMFINHSSKVSKFYFSMLTDAILSFCGHNLELSKDILANNIIDYIRVNFRQNLTLAVVAKACCTNRCEISKTVNIVTRQNFNSYVNMLRVGEFLNLYAQNRNAPISILADNAGFTSLRTFYRVFEAQYKCSPTEYFTANN